eukprot:TRINITY_DN7897_c0_g1_i1.p1 TRINITY_DN7897_c0_g1~~TRINITY_DN7897_c0_g1_i1.p1  ORF type:complete len:493 (+),score=200.11 TRINITY_DN7897_c0_g1_i1:73-1551(+)
MRVAALFALLCAAHAVELETAFQNFIAGHKAPHVEKLGQSCTVPNAHAMCGGFACVNNVCAKCTADAQCKAETEVYACNTVDGDCVLAPLDYMNLSRAEMTVGFLAFLVTCLASVAGIGGGGMLVPLYILVGGFPPGLAVPMSQATIVGCAGLNSLIMMRRTHPEGGPLIDYSVVLILLPMTLCGTMVGHMIGRVLPDWLRLGLLVVLLGYMLKRTMAKAQKAAANDARKTAAAGEVIPLVGKDVEQGSGKKGPALAALLAERFTQYPTDKFAYCGLVWLLLVYLSYYRQHAVACGTQGYWVVTAGILGGMIVLTGAAGHVLKGRDAQALDAGYAMREDEIQWTSSTTMYYPILSITCGIGASLLGIGGGMILGILLFEMSSKIKPEATAATAAVATALVAMKSSAEFYFYGELPMDYGMYFGVIGCFGTVLGQGPIGGYIRSRNKSSLIVYALAGVIAGSLVALAIAGVLNVWTTLASGGSMGFHSLCKGE